MKVLERPGAKCAGRMVVGLLVLAGLVAACGHEDHAGLRFAGTDEVRAPSLEELDIVLEEPVWKEEDIFPCSECHDNDELEANPERRELTMMHEDIVLHHGEKNRWCLDCHDAENRDMLRLANGTLVPFEESFRLCGQCHGDKYRDWRAGAHGRRTGEWNGKKTYKLCVDCHYSHAPAFKPLAPMTPPARPEEIR